jgi:hypothetical protein
MIIVYIALALGFVTIAMFARRLVPRERAAGLFALGLLLGVSVVGPTAAGIVERLPGGIASELGGLRDFLYKTGALFRALTLGSALSLFGVIVFVYRDIFYEMLQERKLALSTLIMSTVLLG